MHWGLIITDTLISEVIPEDYAGYRAPAREALIFFLEGLPEARQSEILKNQISLPPACTAPERISVLARSCPSLHKLGQTLARDHRLSPELRKHLQGLESLPPSLPPEAVQDILTRELGPLDNLGIGLLPAIAEASVAIVVPFRVDRVRSEAASEGVFKILKPGIRERLEDELEMLERVGSYLDQRIGEFGIPRINYGETFEHVRTKLLSEVRLDLEQRNLAIARDIYSDKRTILIPALFREYCTPRVTAMERIKGKKVTEQDLSQKWKKGRLAGLIISELIARPLFSKDGPDLFHGDPHPGNLFLTWDDRLAILDWSLTGSLSEREHAAFSAIILGAITLHPGRIAAALVELTDNRGFDREALRRVVGSALAKISEGRVPGLTWVTSMLDEAVKEAGLRFGADLLLFRRVIHILTGVITDIGGDTNLVDEVLIERFIGSFMLEWPFRWLAPPDSREFATRLSNADITELMFTLPWTAARFWLGQKS